MRKNRNGCIDDLLSDEDFVNWVLNENNVEQNHYWTIWLESNQHRVEDFKKARQVVLSMGYQHFNEHSDSAYSSTLSAIIQHNRQSKNVVSLSYWKMAGIAALILLVPLLSMLVVQNSKETSRDFVTESTLAGQTKIIVLPDGSTINMNAKSSIRYQVPFSNNRNVELNGEAFFEVAHDNDHPFKIKSGNLITTVRGTTFNIRAYPEDDNIKIAVETGLVDVSDLNSISVELFAGNLAIYDRIVSEILIKSDFNKSLNLGWKYGIIFFEDSSMKDVFNYLENWYDVSFDIKDGSIIQGNYTGKYTNPKLEDVLNGIALTSGVSFRIQEDTVFVE